MKMNCVLFSIRIRKKTESFKIMSKALKTFCKCIMKIFSSLQTKMALILMRFCSHSGALGAGLEAQVLLLLLA